MVAAGRLARQGAHESDEIGIERSPGAIRHVEHSGFDMTGQMLDAFPEPKMRDAIYQSYRTVVETRRPQRHHRDLTADGRPLRYEALLMPLAGDGEVIDMILVAIAFQDV